jgi:hypothetical protein
MPRGRQYYDPIVQVPGKVSGEPDLSRIELYPEGGPEDPNPKWRARRIQADGSVAELTDGDFDHDRALAQAQAHWADLPVYELRNEGEDSTWEGHGPSPRLWQNSSPETGAATPPAVPHLSGGPSPEVAASGAGAEQRSVAEEIVSEMMTLVEELPPGFEGGGGQSEKFRELLSHGSTPQPTEEQAQLRVLPIDEPGVYVRLADIVDLLELWAVAYEVDKNPSGALSLREAVDALKEIG